MVNEALKILVVPLFFLFLLSLRLPNLEPPLSVQFLTLAYA